MDEIFSSPSLLQCVPQPISEDQYYLNQSGITCTSVETSNSTCTHGSVESQDFQQTCQTTLQLLSLLPTDNRAPLILPTNPQVVLDYDKDIYDLISSLIGTNDELKFSLDDTSFLNLPGLFTMNAILVI